MRASTIRSSALFSCSGTISDCTCLKGKYGDGDNGGEYYYEGAEDEELRRMMRRSSRRTKVTMRNPH